MIEFREGDIVRTMFSTGVVVCAVREMGDSQVLWVRSESGAYSTYLHHQVELVDKQA